LHTKLFTLLLLALPAFTQTTVKEAVVKYWKPSAEFTMAAARAMPAESCNFRPVPQELSFGQLMAHIGGINLYACANASGLARPPLPPEIAAWAKDTKKVEVDKETAIQFLSDSFDFCIKAACSI